jgi:hypothetical protein
MKPLLRQLMSYIVCFAFATGSAGADADIDVWSSYLDYAYVFTSAEPEALAERLDGYGREAGMTLAQYAHEQFEVTSSANADSPAETRMRRKAIAYLLLYLTEGNPDHLDTSTETARGLRNSLERHENRYWYHYILAHRAMEKGRHFDFVGELLDLWLRVVAPLETPYETLHTLSLSDSPNSGFVSAIPYLYENLSRMILIRSQQMKIDRGLDPLGAIVRLLADGRVGAQPDVIPPEASSRDYLERIVERLDGPESDAGSLTFTLALFEAGHFHERERALLATDGFSSETLKAVRMAAGAYEVALNRANTVQGQCAVYTRVLRLMGEIYAAKQRLGVDPEIDTPFSIEGAIEVYASMAFKLEAGWEDLGYRAAGRQAYVDAMHGLWEEIQEVGLTAADYYLAKSLEDPDLADEHSRDAARIHTRYLALFSRFATLESREAVPDSAYFAAFEAARGYGDALLGYAHISPTSEELKLSTRRYSGAMRLYPFDLTLWPALTHALEMQGRESEYLELVRPVANAVTRSRHIDSWIEGGEIGYQSIAPVRAALGDSLAIMNLGFADAGGIERLRTGLADLQARRDDTVEELTALGGSARRREASTPAALAGGEVVPASLTIETLAAGDRERRVTDLTHLLERLDAQLAARSRALPLYRVVVESEDLTPQLRVRRDHPAHTLLRRIYYENRS